MANINSYYGLAYFRKLCWSRAGMNINDVNLHYNEGYANEDEYIDQEFDRLSAIIKLKATTTQALTAGDTSCAIPEGYHDIRKILVNGKSIPKISVYDLAKEKENSERLKFYVYGRTIYFTEAIDSDHAGTATLFCLKDLRHPTLAIETDLPREYHEAIAWPVGKKIILECWKRIESYQSLDDDYKIWSMSASQLLEIVDYYNSQYDRLIKEIKSNINSKIAIAKI